MSAAMPAPAEIRAMALAALGTDPAPTSRVAAAVGDRLQKLGVPDAQWRDREGDITRLALYGLRAEGRVARKRNPNAGVIWRARAEVSA